MNDLSKSINSGLKTVNNPVIENTLRLAFIIYAANLAPELPQGVVDFFKTPLMKFFVFFLIGWVHTKDVNLSLTAALLVIVIANFIAGRGLFEMFKVEQNTNVHPGCLGLTMNDILAVFNGDSEAMKQTLYNIQVPLSIPLTDEFAPVLATHLINNGYKVSSACDIQV